MHKCAAEPVRWFQVPQIRVTSTFVDVAYLKGVRLF